ncbi:gluconeogenesis factor YvcK family protein [Adlercreutzia aquisgranensis]|uniref:Putative gluconeogenesis factor n=1 Tax=Muribaculaceae bacterium Z82 TaxID=2304548 RepID=A0A7C9NSD5_9BACT|nr:gluconeogenesis factor YvcK family protein [Adlercreutzia aquisgranensis]
MSGAEAFTHDPSLTAEFQPLLHADPVLDAGESVRAVVIGGGTGAPVSIRTLLSMGAQTSAVVAMADDGGSTGILREEADVTPPGDIRKCIAAMAADPDDPLTRAFKYRFAFARNHTLGNLMISALEDACGSFPQAIQICERLLQARGHVYPSTLERVYLEAVTRDGRVIEGQAVACHSRTALERVSLRADGPIRPYEPALQAIREADLVVLGPGSLFTSIIPNLLVPGVTEAIRESKAATLFVCSLADMQGETWGLTAKEHIEALLAHGMEGALDYVLVHSPEPLRPEDMASGLFNAVTGDDDRSSIGQMGDLELSGRVRPVRITYQDIRLVQEAGGPLVIVRNLVDPMHPTWHSPTALRNAFAGVIRLCRSRQR